MKVAVLTGAGISQESGIETFRSIDGLWCNHKIEQVASVEGFEKNPALVHNFYNQRRKQLLNPKIKPNLAHIKLAQFEQNLNQLGHQFLLITQNIDNLHQLAGSKNIIAMHGSLLEVFCLNCQQITFWDKDCDSHCVCPHCAKLGQLRPNIVWFGEIPHQLDRCFDFLNNCDLFASIGTSGQVYPAAGFAQIAKQNTAYCVQINKEKTNQNIFDQFYIGKASEKVVDWIDNISKNNYKI